MREEWQICFTTLCKDGCGYIIQYHKLQYRDLRVFGNYSDQYEKSYVSGAKVTKSDHSEFNISKQMIGSTSSYSLLVDQFAVWETLFTDRVVLHLLSKTQLWQLHENDQSDLIWNDTAMDLLLGYGWLLSDFYYIRGSQHRKAYFGFSYFRYSVFKSLVSNMPSIGLWSYSDCDEHEITTK